MTSPPHSHAIRAAVLGGDVSKSRSPAIHAAALSALSIDGRYQAFSVDASGFRPLVRRLAAEGYRYVNVTIPHKRAAAAVATTASPLVRATRAANTLIFGRSSGRGRARPVRAENTDGYGLLAALGELGVRVSSADVIVLVGSGGAAAGALAALLAHGARVRLLARRPAAARALARGLSPAKSTRVAVTAWTPAALADAVTGAAALVSAVPAAAWENEDAVAGLHALASGGAVLEMAYGGTTPLSQTAIRRGAHYQDGIPMLVHQAARAIELALGHMPPTAPMFEAARR